MDEIKITKWLSKANPLPTLEVIIAKLDLSEDFPNLGQLLVTYKVVKSEKVFDTALAAARRSSAIIQALGTNPATTKGFIEALMEQCGYTLDASKPQPMTWVCPYHKSRRRFETDKLLSFAKDRNRNLLSNRFKTTDICDEVEATMIEAEVAIYKTVLAKIMVPAPFDWQTLVARCFDTTETSADITIAVLKKFIWQVKRRMVADPRYPVTFHMLPIIYGNQGCGKSRFCESMLAPLGSLWTTADFGRVCDNREADLFRRYAIFLDEMEKSDKAAMETVKTVITRETVSYRPMGTNSTVQYTQNSTFIGTSNKLLSQLINDPTGNRRFFQISFNGASGQAEWDYVNALDFTAMWASVDHRAEDPAKPFADQIAAIQKSAINHNSVGLFANLLVENQGVYQAMTDTASGAYEEQMPATPQKKEDLFKRYRRWCRAMSVSKPVELQAFLSELRRMSGQSDSFPFQPRKTASFNGWIFESPDALLVGVPTTANPPVLA